MLLKLREFLGRQGVEVDLFDPWQTRFGDYQIVHCFSWYTAGLWPEIKLQGAKVVVTPIHYPGTKRWKCWAARARAATKQWFLPHRYRLSLEYYFGFVDLLLPNSWAEARAINAWYRFPMERVAVIPNGVDASFLHGDDGFPRTYGLTDYVLTIGRISRNKNQRTLIRAVNRAGVPLAIVGRPDATDGDYDEACRREARDNVVFVGHLFHDDPLLRSAYACAAVFVLPSFSEISSLAILEAGLAGTRVLTTADAPVKEHLGTLVSYVDPHSEQDIARKILTALDTPRSTDLQEHVWRHFLWETVAEQTAAAYTRLCEHPQISEIPARR